MSILDGKGPPNSSQFERVILFWDLYFAFNLQKQTMALTMAANGFSGPVRPFERRLGRGGPTGERLTHLNQHRSYT